MKFQHIKVMYLTFANDNNKNKKKVKVKHFVLFQRP